METETPEENERATAAPSDIEWEHRVLCSDGNCIGVIGSDGRCKECGEKYEGALPEDHFSASEGQTPEDISFEKEDPSFEDLPQEAAESSEHDDSLKDSDWQDRVLCSDGNCIGVIGPDGRCKECGKPPEENSDL